MKNKFFPVLLVLCFFPGKGLRCPWFVCARVVENKANLTHNEKAVLVCHWASERNWPWAVMQFIRAVLGNPLPVLLSQSD